MRHDADWLRLGEAGTQGHDGAARAANTTTGESTQAMELGSRDTHAVWSTSLFGMQVDHGGIMVEGSERGEG